MAIEVKIDAKSKIVLDFWVSKNGAEYLTLRKFYPGKGDQWFPDPKNGVYFPIETWEAVIPRIQEMIYFKRNPAGNLPSEEGKRENAEGEGPRPPRDDF